MKTQSEELAENIVALLVSEKLLLEGDGVKLRSKMADGKVKASDWLLAVEKAMEKEVAK